MKTLIYPHICGTIGKEETWEEEEEDNIEKHFLYFISTPSMWTMHRLIVGVEYKMVWR